MKTYWELEAYQRLECEWCYDANKDTEFYKVEDQIVCRNCLECECPEEEESLSLWERNQ